MRSILFGDAPISGFARDSASTRSNEPWKSFLQVRLSVETGHPEAARDALQSVLRMPGLESRHYLQAWHYLRDLGVQAPIQIQKELLGVVVEVGMKDGLDLLAAYADHHARYFNYSGKAVIWERPDDTLDPTINRLFSACHNALNSIGGPWENEKPPAPGFGNARINLLTPSGLYVGQGPFQALMKDRLGGPVLVAATELTLQLIKLAKTRGHALRCS
jgi:hypothetical protein